MGQRGGTKNVQGSNKGGVWRSGELRAYLQRNASGGKRPQGIIQALQSCCCTTQQSILKMGYENQLAVQGQTNALQQSLDFVNRSVERGFSATGYQSAQDKCDIIRANQDNTQRIIDTLNAHWNADLQQKYNDARLELSQQRQNAMLIAALKTTATAAAT